MATGGATDDLLAVFTVAYQEVKRTRREPAPGDRLIEDLGLDSLDTIDILALVEEATGVSAADEVTARFDEITTVGDLLDCAAPLFAR
jgi:acyl carrier protein